MKDFNNMSYSEINYEMEKFQRQVLEQQSKGIPVTEKQMRYYYVLSKAFRRINAEIAK